jgi:hypothetical protein
MADLPTLTFTSPKNGAFQFDAAQTKKLMDALRLDATDLKGVTADFFVDRISWLRSELEAKNILLQQRADEAKAAASAARAGDSTPAIQLAVGLSHAAAVRAHEAACEAEKERAAKAEAENRRWIDERVRNTGYVPAQ